MGIELVDLVSMIVLPIGALIFLGLAFAFRGMWWWSIMSGLLWILFGYASMQMLTPVFWYQRELSVAWITIGIAIFWMPAWYKKKAPQLTMQEIAARRDGEDVGEDDEDRIDEESAKLRFARWQESRGQRKQ